MGENIFVFINRLRNEYGMSIQQLAARTGLSESEIEDYEFIRKRPKPYALRKFSEAFDYPYAKILKIAGVIDSYESEDKVNRFFEMLDLLPNETIHIDNIEDLNKGDILTIVWQFYANRKLSK